MLETWRVMGVFSGKLSLVVTEEPGRVVPTEDEEWLTSVIAGSLIVEFIVSMATNVLPVVGAEDVRYDVTNGVRLVVKILAAVTISLLFDPLWPVDAAAVDGTIDILEDGCVTFNFSSVDAPDAVSVLLPSDKVVM